MRRTIPLLSGLAILGVIFNHANWHALRAFAAGQIGGYPYIVTDQIGKFAIVGFLFIAGYFSAYATNAGKTDLRWEVVRARLLGLLWPWLFWAIFFTLAQAIQGGEFSPEKLPGELLYNLFIQYYFIPLLMFYYLLAPAISHWARFNARSLLWVSAILQVVGIGLFYLRVYWPGFPPALQPWIDVGPLQYLRFAFAFPLGMFAGMFPQRVKEPLAKLKRPLPWLVLVFFGLSAIESGFAYHYGAQNPAVWSIGGDQTRLSAALFSLAFVACFIVYENIKLPLNNQLIKMGTRSYGLYLSHYVILGILGKVLQRILPDALQQGWLIFPTLFILTAVLAMLLMEIVARSPFKRIYRYIFG